MEGRDLKTFSRGLPMNAISYAKSRGTKDSNAGPGISTSMTFVVGNEAYDYGRLEKVVLVANDAPHQTRAASHPYLILLVRWGI
jgi:hypothetical protein